VPGLSMTRAFGDSVAARIGLRAKPEILQIVLTPEDRYLLLMSDGIYEFTDNQQLMEIVHKKVCPGFGHCRLLVADVLVCCCSPCVFS
jgi:serine/threonine protein phosphatase PrpC